MKEPTQFNLLLQSLYWKNGDEIEWRGVNYTEIVNQETGEIRAKIVVLHNHDNQQNILLLRYDFVTGIIMWNHVVMETNSLFSPNKGHGRISLEVHLRNNNLLE